MKNIYLEQTEGQMDRGKTVYLPPPPPFGGRGDKNKKNKKPK
jgi:hypothetical protein